MKRQSRSFVFFILFFGLGLFTGWEIFKLSTNQTLSLGSEIHQGKQNFINPLLSCELQKETGDKSLRDLKKQIEKIINEQKKENLTNRAAVYYRELDNGSWFGINETQSFAPASLLKVPIMISYFRLAQNDPRLLNQTITLDQSFSDKQHAQSSLEIGHDYSIYRYIEEMILLSDNASFNLLLQNLPEDIVQETHQDLGLTYPEQDTPDDFVNVKDYAALFQVLYNASYLNREYSQIALELLTRTKFNQALNNGIPQNITIAHKFGVTNSAESDNKQLHDCGIIYHPEKTYLLCIMTQGSNHDRLIESISRISQTVFREVNQ